MDDNALFPHSEELYQAWSLRKEVIREMEFQKYADLLFTYLEETVLQKENVDAWFAELMEKCKLAETPKDLYVDIWSYKSALYRRQDAPVMDRCTRLSVENDCVTILPPKAVTWIVTMTDVLHRIAGLFGSRFWISIHSVPLPSREESFEWNHVLRLEYWPDGLPEDKLRKVQAAYRKYRYEHDTYSQPFMTQIVVSEPN